MNTPMNDEDRLMNLRHLCEAIKLIGDAIKDDSNHVTNALYSIANAMLAHIEALDKEKKPQ
jgi:hypothetical protein